MDGGIEASSSVRWRGDGSGLEMATEVLTMMDAWGVVGTDGWVAGSGRREEEGEGGVNVGVGDFAAVTEDRFVMTGFFSFE